LKKYRDPNLNRGQLAIVYATAGHEVRAWLQHTGTPGLRKLCDDLRAGTDFADAYSSATRQKN
jgi:hypothetical protein